MEKLILRLLLLGAISNSGIVGAVQEPPERGLGPTSFGLSLTATVARLDPPLVELLSQQELFATSHLDDALQELVHAYRLGSADLNSDLADLILSTAVRYGDMYQLFEGDAVIDITVVGDIELYKAQLMALTGVEIIAIADAGYYYLISASVPIDQILEMASLSDFRMAVAGASANASAVEGVVVPHAPNSQGTANNQAENALEVDAIRRVFPGTDGSGVSLGTISDSVSQVGGGIADSQATGDLPANPRINVIQDSSAAGVTDEGRAMMEHIYDIAPGLTSLGFATGKGGEANFAANITALGQAGMDIINDDLVYFSEPYYQDGVIAQAVSSYIATGGIYFSLNHNYANLSYEGLFTDVDADNFHEFAGADELAQITIATGQSIRLGLQWAEPQASAAVDLSIQIWSSGGTITLLASSNTNNIGGNPYDSLTYANTTGAPLTANIAVKRISGNANGLTFKYIAFANGAWQVSFNQFAADAAGTITPHAGQTSSIAIGAAPYFSRNVAESFSGIGPHRRFFNNGGNAVGPFTFDKPDFLSIDNCNTTFFGTDIANDTDVLPNFSGTSAATPNAAAVAALMLERAGGPGSLSQTDVKAAIRGTIIDLGVAGHDTTFGHGRIHGLGATVAAEGPRLPEATIYLNQFGDASYSSNLFAQTDIDTIEFSMRTSGSTVIDLIESHITMDPMLVVFSQVLDSVDATDYDSGPGDDARIVANLLGGIPHSVEIITEEAFTGTADYTLVVDGPDQEVVDRTGNLDANGDHLGLAGTTFIIGESDYIAYTAPFSGSLNIDIAASGMTLQAILYDVAGAWINSTVVNDGNTGSIPVAVVAAGEQFVLQIASFRYDETGSFVTDVNFDPEQFSLSAVKSGSGSGTVTSNPGGINCGVDCSEFYDSGTSIVLTATPSGGSSFGHWVGDCIASGNQCTVTLIGSRSISAEFIAPGAVFADSFE